jgi:uncharacterized membrane protein
MVNPFDPRTVLLAKHAQHVVLIHFPIALFLSGFLFDLAAQAKRGSFDAVAYYNVTLAAVFAVPTVISGVLAWHWQLEGRRIHGVLLLHILFAASATVLILATAFLHWLARRRQDRDWRRIRISLEALAAISIALAAHLGGFVSGVNSTF